MQDLDKSDIQGLVSRGYGKLPKARFLLLQVTDAAIAKKYLADLGSQVNTIDYSPPDFAIAIAFTADGLKAIGVNDTILKTFSREFLEGMDDPYRSFLLGDDGDSQPANWKWGGPHSPRVHMLLLLYAKDDILLDQVYKQQVENQDFKQGLTLVSVKETTTLEYGKEHFGFRDGLTQPDMEGLVSADLEKFRKPATPRVGDELKIKAGEFVLGYKNEYDNYSESPEVPLTDDPGNILPVKEQEGPSVKDLGKNGTYLVYREIEQHVLQFWKYLQDNADDEMAGGSEAAAIKLGAKMVGRWPNGTPVTLAPDKEVDTINIKSQFGYFDNDRRGEKCPVGAHIRRTNPRDELFEKGKDTSIEVIRKHQLIRRGRAFGTPVVPSLKPEDIMKVLQDDGSKRGLHFICLNASISRQFEFIQNIWVKSSKFGGMYNDADPLLGARGNLKNEFTCPVENGVREKYRDIPSFATVIGGAYFFLPGVKALRFLVEG
jgi:Dyp-type peroxidase family